MIRRFCSGSSTPASRARNRSRASTMTRFIPRFASKVDPQQLRLLLAHQPVVDVDAGQPVADRPVDERGRDRRVDAARQGADDLAVGAGRARRGASTRSRIPATVVSMKLAAVQVGSSAGDADHEVAQDVAAARRVDDLGMELDRRTGCAPGRRGRRTAVESVWAVGVEALGQPGDRVAVAHPDRLLALEAREQAVVGGDRDGRRAVLALRRPAATSPPSSWAISWAP